MQLNIMRHQHGNTLLGFILGLVISLCVCAVIALKWNQIPAGFVAAVHEKSSKGTAPTTEISAPVKTIPNLGMSEYPKKYETPATEKTVTASSDQSIPVTQSVMNATAPQNEKQYKLQAGSFKRNEEAESIRAQLAIIGIEAAVIKRVGDDGTIYRVIAGPYSGHDMKDFRNKIQESGIQVIAVRAKN